MTDYTIKDIKSAYIQKREWEKQFPIYYYFVRPVSFYLTYIVLKFTKNPAKVAVFGFFIGAISCMLFIGSSIWTLWPGIISIIIYSFFDASDGNVARTTDNVTLYGIYFDGLLGLLIEKSYLFFVGFGLAFKNNQFILPGFPVPSTYFINILPLLLGSLIILSILWSDIFRNLHDTYKIKKEGLSPNSEGRVSRAIGKSRYHDRWYYLLFISMDSTSNQLLLLILSVIFKIELLFLILFSIFYCSKALFFFFFYHRKTKNTLSSQELFSQPH